MPCLGWPMAVLLPIWWCGFMGFNWQSVCYSSWSKTELFRMKMSEVLSASLFWCVILFWDVIIPVLSAQVTLNSDGLNSDGLCFFISKTCQHYQRVTVISDHTLKYPVWQSQLSIPWDSPSFAFKCAFFFCCSKPTLFLHTFFRLTLWLCLKVFSKKNMFCFSAQQFFSSISMYFSNILKIIMCSLKSFIILSIGYDR